MSAIIILLFILIIISYGVWYFVFNIYEVRCEINYVKNLTENIRLFEVQNTPINLFGGKVPFRKLEFEYEIIKGGNLIEVVEKENKYELLFRTSQKEGTVIIIIKTKLGLFPQRIEYDLSNNFNKTDN